jgi:hypothetical protein
MVNIQSWFIPFDILMIICTVITIILATLFLSIIALNKTCRTVPMMLIANSCLAELVFACSTLSMASFTLQNDMKQIQYQNSLCLFGGYMSYMSTGIQSYSYLLQAIYRYIIIVYPFRLFWQSAQFQGLLICLTWICGIIYPIPIVLKSQIIYLVDDQICQMPPRFSFLIIFNASYNYLIPMGGIMLIYFQMIRYVKEVSKRVTSANALFRAQRELKMVHRIVSLITIIMTTGIPYTIFVLMSFFNRVPKYHFRIAFLFVDLSLVFVMVTLFQFTDPLKTSVMKRIKPRPNVVVARVA